ncbi:hypothetical protein G7046_g4901 [Stylonectria norvegica]|nr:hypothetical protein G7046_g4901 [Stylonectria norvegica]
MLDVEDFIEERGGNPEKIRQSQRLRNDPVELVDEVINLWQEARRAKYEFSQIGTQINGVQKQIGLKKRAKEDATELLQQKEELTQKKNAQEAIAEAKNNELRIKARLVGNYVHESVPVSDNEDNNEVIRTWKPEGFSEANKQSLSHHEVLWRLGGYDPIRGVKLVGHRGYCLTGYGMFLNMALINYGMETLFNKGYTPNQPPFFLDRDQMAKTAQLSQFDEELYRVSEGNEKADSDKYLIATSEQPLSCLHADEWVLPGELPIKYAGYSTCFRKEAGSHGRDAWGVFRVHQFEKVEQFVLCNPDDSWQHFDEMMATSEEFYQSLKLPYQVVAIVSGALNNAAAKKQDLEAWFPYQSEYKELVSCSNCTDYQTRELEIRHGSKKGKTIVGGGKKEYVHALNATLCATERTLCCVLENYQTEEGLVVPEVLRKYIPGQPEFLPYVKAAPERSEKTEKAAGTKKEAVKKEQTLPPFLEAHAASAMGAGDGCAEAFFHADGDEAEWKPSGGHNLETLAFASIFFPFCALPHPPYRPPFSHHRCRENGLITTDAPPSGDATGRGHGDWAREFHVLGRGPTCIRTAEAPRWGGGSVVWSVGCPCFLSRAARDWTPPSEAMWMQLRRGLALVVGLGCASSCGPSAHADVPEATRHGMKTETQALGAAAELRGPCRMSMSIWSTAKAGGRADGIASGDPRLHHFTLRRLSGARLLSISIARLLPATRLATQRPVPSSLHLPGRVRGLATSSGRRLQSRLNYATAQSHRQAFESAPSSAPFVTTITSTHQDDLMSASVVRSTALRAGGACVRCRKGKTKCVYENGRAPCKNCAKGMHDCYLPSESMAHHHGQSPARHANPHRPPRDSLPASGAGGVAETRQPVVGATGAARHVQASSDKYVFGFLSLASDAPLPHNFGAHHLAAQFSSPVISLHRLLWWKIGALLLAAPVRVAGWPAAAPTLNTPTISVRCSLPSCTHRVRSARAEAALARWWKMLKPYTVTPLGAMGKRLWERC